MGAFMQVNAPLLTFQGGIIGEELHNRVDIETYPSGAAQMRNWRPTLQGPMERRPPLIHVDTVETSLTTGVPIGMLLGLTREESVLTDLQPELFPFVFSTAANYLVRAQRDGFTFYANDGVIAIDTNSSTLSSSWTDQSASPSVIQTIGSNIWLDADGANEAVAEKTITVSNDDRTKTHVLAFEIGHGPLDIRIGTSSGAKDVLAYERLRAGYHRLAFTPGANTVYLQFRHSANAGRYFRNDVSILPGTTFSLPCPFLEEDLKEVQYQQVRDVLYMVHEDYWPRRLERRGDRSWSIVLLLPDDGPFADINTSDITIAGSATSGEITLTASEDLFEDSDVGALWQITGGGQTRSATISSADSFTSDIKVTGIAAASRTFNLAITGTFSGTVTLQRSSGTPDNWTDWQTYTVATSVNIYDAQDNQTWYYRAGIKSGDYTSGTAAVSLTYSGGSSDGMVRVIEYNSATQVTAEVLPGRDLPNTDAVKTWRKGDWNATDGFPSAISDAYARLWFGRGSKLWASKVDNFTSFETVTDEDDSSFSRNMATPSSDAIRWLANVDYLAIGTSSIEQVGLGNTQSDPVSPTNWDFKDASEEGGAPIQPITVGSSVLFVSRSRRKLLQLLPNPKALSETSYIAIDLTARAPEILDDEIIAIGVQREPETRVFVILRSGRLAELLFRRDGDVDIAAWSVHPTDGRFERVIVLPRAGGSANERYEDVVYFLVRRQNADGDWRRYIERYGPSRPLMDCERYHLDSALGYELTKPNAVVTPSATSSPEGEALGMLMTLTAPQLVNVESDVPVFTSGDVGKVMWINGGRGIVRQYVDASNVKIDVTSDLVGLNPNHDGTDPCPAGKWGLGTSTTTLTGLDHEEGRSVRVWGDMTDLGDYTVASGAITLSQAVSVAYVGRTFQSRFQSLKLAYGARAGTAIGMKKGIKRIILLLHNAHASLVYGYNTSKMRRFKRRMAPPPYGEPLPLFTGESDNAFDAKYDEDLRLFLQVDGPAPAIVSGAVIMVDEKDRVGG